MTHTEIVNFMRSFSASKYGESRARLLAIQARRRGVAEMLRQRATM